MHEEEEEKDEDDENKNEEKNKTNRRERWWRDVGSCFVLFEGTMTTGFKRIYEA